MFNMLTLFAGYLYLSITMCINYCELDGSSSYYVETFVNKPNENRNVRRITTNGCPNHVIRDNPDPQQPPFKAVKHEFEINLPATPCFSNSDPVDLTNSNVRGAFGITLTGVLFFEETDSSGQPAIGRDLDGCGGHPTGSSSQYTHQYHHHLAPICLLDQIHDPIRTTHSEQIGWAYDGFPIYGPRGNGGQIMDYCSQISGNQNCLDECGGHKDEHDNFKYHYHTTTVSGGIGQYIYDKIDTANIREPYQIRCLVGVPKYWGILRNQAGNNAVCSNKSSVATNFDETNIVSNRFKDNNGIITYDPWNGYRCFPQTWVCGSSAASGDEGVECCGSDLECRQGSNGNGPYKCRPIQTPAHANEEKQSIGPQKVLGDSKRNIDIQLILIVFGFVATFIFMVAIICYIYIRILSKNRFKKGIKIPSEEDAEDEEESLDEIIECSIVDTCTVGAECDN